MGKEGTTRAWISGTPSGTGEYNGGIITTTGDNETKKLYDAEFGVFAYQTGSADWTADSKVAEFMYNQKITWTATSATPNNTWVYEPVKYWPNGVDAANADNDPSNTAWEKSVQKLSFFAYAPYTANATTIVTQYPDGDAPYGTYPAGITKDDVFQTTAYSSATSKGGVIGMTDWDAQKDPWLNYYLHDPLTSNAVDLLWGLRGQYNYDETDNTDNLQVDKLGNTYNVNLTKQSVDEKVRFLFKHALSKFAGSTKDLGTGAVDTKPAQSGLKIVLDVDANTTDPGVGADNQTAYFPAGFDKTKTLVTVKSLKIQDAYTFEDESNVIGTAQKSNLNTYGWFNISTGQWVNGNHKTEAGPTGDGATLNYVVSDGEGTNLKLNDIIREIGANEVSASVSSKKSLDATDKTIWSTTNPTGVDKGTPIPVFNNVNNPGIVLIPSGDKIQTLYITVDYFVRTADPQLKKGWSEVEQIITNKVDLVNLEPNKYYTLVIHLGLTSVKFEAVVVDWSQNPEDTYDEDGNIHEVPTTEDKDIVWLPSNVVNTTTISADANSTHKEVAVAGHTTEYTIDLTGLTKGSTIDAEYAVDPSGTNASTKAGSPTYTSSSSSVQIDGKAKLTVTLPVNNTSTPRTYTVTIKEKDALSNVLSTTKVTIKQAAGELVLTPANASISTDAADFTANLTNGGGANVDVAATPTTLTAVDQDGSDKDNTGTSITLTHTTNTITVPVKANPYVGPRKWTLTLTQDGLTATTTVVQAAGAPTINTIAVGTPGTNVSVSGKNLVSSTSAPMVTTPTLNVQVNSVDVAAANISYTSNASWLTVNSSTGAISATENKTGIDRVATVYVTVTDKYGSASTSYTVTQKGY